MWECMGMVWPFLIVISMIRTESFSKIIFADFGAALRMCLAKLGDCVCFCVFQDSKMS